MAAITCALLQLCNSGDHIVASMLGGALLSLALGARSSANAVGAGGVVLGCLAGLVGLLSGPFAGHVSLTLPWGLPMGPTAIECHLKNGNQIKDVGYQLTVGYGYFFHPNWGVETGLGIQTFRSQIVLSSMSGYSSVDKSGIAYEYRNYFNGWQEKQNFTLLSIPVGLRGVFPVFDHLGLTASGGVKLLMPVSSTYAYSDGSITTTGYYSSTNMARLSAELLAPDGGRKKRKNLEVRDTSMVKMQVDSLAGLRDSTYWQSVRKMPLLADEIQSFRRVDSIQVPKSLRSTDNGVELVIDEESVRKGNLLKGGCLVVGDSVFFRYSGLIKGAVKEYNFVDGWWLGQRFSLSMPFTKTSRLSITP